MMYRVSNLDTASRQGFFVGPGTSQQPEQQLLIFCVPVNDILEFLAR